MWSKIVFLIFVCILHSHSVLSIWSCSLDSECSSPSGSICQSGMCVCPSNMTLVLGGTICAPPAPYLTSPCLDDLQCTNLITSFECRRGVNDTIEDAGQCACKPGFHYFVGRCWKSIDFGGACERSEECFGALRDPLNMACQEGTCVCSPGYYERQRGECRRSGLAVGDGCILDQDCQFNNGVCDLMTLRCINSNNPFSYKTAARNEVRSNVSISTSLQSSLTRNHGSACGPQTQCASPFVCSTFGSCVCPRGYYPNTAGTTCFAELGTTSTEAQCAGFLAEVVDGICSCPSNMYYEENMRDCVKATRRITDSCVSNQMCHTFGAASVCGKPQGVFEFRNCECIAEQAVWDEERNMCRLFAGIGESCQVNSDCMAGTLEILCVQGTCTCPEGTDNIDGYCLTTGLSLGDECQMTQECTGTENTVCEEGRCSCGVGYQEREDICAPAIGGECQVDEDCAIENTACFNISGVMTCQCGSNFVQYDDVCWPALPSHTEECTVMAQCIALLGPGSNCTEDNHCECTYGHHFRDGRCWPITGLFESCSRSSECFLGELSHRVQCRNSLCQCSFDYPYSEALHTCTGVDVFGNVPGSASIAVSSLLTIVLALFYISLH